MDSQQQIFADDTSLIPAIIQDEVTKKVLMLAYMNKEAYLKTISTKETWFFSRKRQQLWHKGATSGNRQIVKRIVYDCDADSLLIEVSPLGPACHTGKETCFHHTVYATEKTTTDIIEQLTETIKKRRNNPVDGSYTTYLFHEGLDKILKKVGEEASEVIIGAKNEDRSELLWEISDLTYHLLVLMELMDIKVSDIKNVLQKRHFGNKGAK